MNYIFYLRYPGFGSSWKCGISGINSAWSRLGSYQNAFGPEYKEQWKHIFVGDAKHIKLLESKFKERFADRILGDEAGYSEWITKTSEEELLSAVKFFRDEYCIKFVDVPEEFKPFDSSKIESLKLWTKDQTCCNKLNKKP